MYDKKVIKTFLDNQTRLFDEPVAENEREAQEFLEEVCAQVCGDRDELVEILDDEMDISELSDEEIIEIEEVFAIDDGRYLVVWG